LNINTKIVKDLLSDEDVVVSRRTDKIIVYPGRSLNYGSLSLMLMKYGLKFRNGKKCYIVMGWNE